jgi:hypothetical protein
MVSVRPRRLLDAHQSAMSGGDVMGFVSARSRWSPLRAESAQYWRRGAVIVHDDGRWELDPRHDAVRSMREAVRERVSAMRRWAEMRPDPVAMEAHRKRIERERSAHADRLAAMRRVLLHPFPATRPRALALVDVGRREVSTFLDDDMTVAIARLAEYEIVGAVNVRALLRSLAVDPGDRRLAELGPPQKTRQLTAAATRCADQMLGTPSRHASSSAAMVIGRSVEGKGPYACWTVRNGAPRAGRRPSRNSQKLTSSSCGSSA